MWAWVGDASALRHAALCYGVQCGTACTMLAASHKSASCTLWVPEGFVPGWPTPTACRPPTCSCMQSCCLLRLSTGAEWCLLRMLCTRGAHRRVTLGIELVVEPSILLLDEPTTGLDAHTALQLMRTLKQVRMSSSSARHPCLLARAPARQRRLPACLWFMQLLALFTVATPAHACPGLPCPACHAWHGMPFPIPFFSSIQLRLCRRGRWRPPAASCCSRSTSPLRPCSPFWTEPTCWPGAPVCSARPPRPPRTLRRAACPAHREPQWQSTCSRCVPAGQVHVSQQGRRMRPWRLGACLPAQPDSPLHSRGAARCRRKCSGEGFEVLSDPTLLR